MSYIIREVSNGSFRPLTVFVSYAAEDRPVAAVLNQQLQTAGFDPWFDRESITPGTEWDPDIRRAIHESDAVVVCISSVSVLKSGYIQKELKAVKERADEMPSGCKFMFPVKLGECSVPSDLQKYQALDLFKVSKFSSADRVIDRRALVKLFRALGERALQLEKTSSAVQIPEIVAGRDCCRSPKTSSPSPLLLSSPLWRSTFVANGAVRYEFFRHQQIYPPMHAQACKRDSLLALPPPSSDESATGYSSASCTPALLASASPAIRDGEATSGLSR
jgi:TIR domain